ncbi:MAG: multidrug transporter [Gemmatimonadota bacterium]|nr:multidrug transporter [Gemmatimonadota bacterium]
MSAANPPSQVTTDSGVATVILDSAAFAHGGIVTTALPAIRYRAAVTGYGTVLDVESLAAARTAMAAAQAAAARTAVAAQAADAELARVRALHADSQNVSTKVLQAAEASAGGAHADADAARAAERAAVATEQERWGPVVGGWIARGDRALDALLERQRVLVLVAVPVGTPLVAAPRSATIRASGRPIQVALISAAAQTDARTQGQTFFYSAPAAPELRAGTNVTAALATGPTGAATDVPRSAVVWAEGGAWIYVKTGPTSFTRQPIPTDAPTADGYAVMGLSAGTAVVTRGAQFLLSEEYRAHAPASAASGDADG